MPGVSISAACSPPCFYWKSCRRRAELEKGGKSVCRLCAQRMRGFSYPLRLPSREPLYLNAHAAAEAMDMIEPKRKRRSRLRKRGELR